MEVTFWGAGYTAFCITLAVLLAVSNIRSDRKKKEEFLRSEKNYFVNLDGKAKKSQRIDWFEYGRSDYKNGRQPRCNHPDYECGYGQEYAEAEAKTALAGGV